MHELELMKYLKQYRDCLTLSFTLDEEMVEDIKLDDAFSINIKMGKGGVVASNERSLLFSVYRILKAIGFEWLYPGKEGEFIPDLSSFDFSSFSLVTTEVASNRVRGYCMEGGFSVEQLIDTIDFLPKQFFNTYFFQFLTPFNFLNDYYLHKGNNLFKPCHITEEFAVEVKKEAIREIQKRHLLIHDMGHGWTGRCFGIESRGWINITKDEQSLVDNSLLAQLNGKREIYAATMSCTNLCYSNERVREKMALSITDYAKNHKEVDYLHIWLADSANNFCECEECQKKRLSDWYVILMNKIDEEFTKANLDTKIVFLCYNDLLYPPKEARINNEDRFYLMFAPIERLFETNFNEVKELPELPLYEHNKMRSPHDVALSLSYLKGWTDVFHGNVFDFDYYLIRARHGDLNSEVMSQTAYQDIKAYKKLKLSGLMSCQETRAYFPTGLTDYVIGNTLWRETSDYEQLKTHYYEKGFGKNSKMMKDFLSSLTSFIHPDYFLNRYGKVNDYYAKEYEQLINLIEPLYLTYEDDETVLGSYFSIALEWMYFFSKALRYKAMGEEKLADIQIDKVAEITRKLEITHPMLNDNFEQERFLSMPWCLAFRDILDSNIVNNT